MKQRHLFAALLGAALVLSTLPATSAFAVADDFYSGPDEEEPETITSGAYTYSVMVNPDENNKKAACIESYSGSDENLVIPATLDGLSVVSLGDRAFSGNSTAKTITLPASVIGTGLYTFSGCTNVEEFIVAADNPYYEAVDGVLYGDERGYLVQYPIAKQPTTVTVPDGVYDIGNSAFSEIQSLKEVILPDTVEFIGVWAFASCASLEKINIPAAVTELEDFCFAYCTSLNMTTVPSTITAIDAGAFAGCTAIQEFTIPASVTSIGQAAFTATGLTTITIPSTVTSIGYYAFGYKLDSERQFVADAGFIIRGAAGSEAQKYASDSETENSFVFKPIISSDDVDLGKVEIGKTTDTVAKQDNENGGISRAVKLALFGAGGVVLLVGGVLAAILVGKKKKQQPAADREDNAE